MFHSIKIQIAFVAAILFPLLAFSQDVKLLSSFEYDAMQTWGWSGIDITSYNGRYGTLYQGDATDGQWAIGHDFSQDAVSWYLSGTIPPENNILTMQGVIFKTFGYFGTWMGIDWSGYDRLRIDVKSTVDSCVLWLQLQDELTSPFIVRQYRVPANQWVTLEFNLADAAQEIKVPLSSAGATDWGVDTLKGRILNLSHMANFYVNAVRFYGLHAQHVVLDNMRLLKPGVADGSALPVITDNSAWPQVAELPPQTPVWNKYTGTRDNALLTLDTPAVSITPGINTSYGYLNGNPRALSAVDNQRLIMGLDLSVGGVIKSVDGGQTWSNPGGFFHSINAPGNFLSGADGDLFGFYTERCGGGSAASAMYFRHLKFNGTGWTMGTPYMITPNSFHCPEWKVDGLRLPDGRIWMATAHQTRYGVVYLRAWYSDDEGLTWRWPNASGLMDAESWRTHGARQGGLTGAEWWVENSAQWNYEGKTSSLGTITSSVTWPDMYPLLVPYEGTVGCLWLNGSVKWSYYNNNAWTPPATIFPSSINKPYTAVTYGTSMVYFTMGDKIYQFDGTHALVDITPALCKGGVLSLSNDVLLNLWQETGGVIRFCTKQLPDGNWSEATTVATAGSACRLTAPMYSPDNYFPVAWMGSSLKFLRIPNPHATVAVQVATTPQGLSILTNSPNPFRQFTAFKYHLPMPGAVSLKIYDRCGKLVKSLVQAQQGAGPHTVKWNANGLATGIYFAKIKANGLASSRKILIVR
ncbi:MAG: T9SS type A sorting domain-containing protein [Fibrobacterota bacterium]